MKDLLKGAAIGAGISLVLWLIPIVHFVAGPLGPFFGGLIAGSMAKARPLEALGVAALMGIVVGVGMAVVIGTLLSALEGFGIRLPFRSGPDVAALFGGALGAYTFLVGSLGAMLGGFFARKSKPRPVESQAS
jgi:hypothetical protein